MKKYKYAFTVFTPTFNRAYTLHRVFESLQKQTFKNFEWLVIDDGSTDNTKQSVKSFQKNANFPIRYYFQKNSGKHIAHNRAVKIAKGEMFLTFDSDDECKPETLERFKFYWDLIPKEENKKFCGVTCLCNDENGKIVGDKFPKNILDCSSLDLRYKLKIKGEKWGFVKTEILENYLFPEISSSTYIYESIVWFEIAKKHKTRFVNEVLRIYHTEQTDSLTTAHAVQTVLIWTKYELNNTLNYFWHSPVYFILLFNRFIALCFHQKVGVKEQSSYFKPLSAKIFWMIILPTGFLRYLIKKKGQIFERVSQPIINGEIRKLLIAKYLSKLNFSRFFKMKLKNVKFFLFPSAISLQMWATPNKIDFNTEFFTDYLKEGDVVIDIGANVGTVTCFCASLVGAKGKVYAIEPSHKTYAFLVENVKLNKFPQVITLNYALGNREGKSKFSNFEADDRNCIIGKAQEKQKIYGKSQYVNVKKLDKLQLNENVIHLLKIDTEGYEKFVLGGAKKTLQKCKVVYFESYGENFQKYDYNLKDLIEFFSKNNFFVLKIVDGKKLLVLDCKYFSEICENLLAVKNPGAFAKEIGYEIICN